MMHAVRLAMVADLRGCPPHISVEFARKALFSDIFPGRGDGAGIPDPRYPMPLYNGMSGKVSGPSLKKLVHPGHRIPDKLPIKKIPVITPEHNYMSTQERNDSEKDMQALIIRTGAVLRRLHDSLRNAALDRAIAEVAGNIGKYDRSRRR